MGTWKIITSSQNKMCPKNMILVTASKINISLFMYDYLKKIILIVFYKINLIEPIIL